MKKGQWFFYYTALFSLFTLNPGEGGYSLSSQSGYVFRDFCLKQGIEFIIFRLNQGIDVSIFVLNWISFLGR